MTAVHGPSHEDKLGPAINALSIAHQMSLLAHFSLDRQALTASEIGDIIGLLPATVDLLAENLVRLHCLHWDSASGTYRLAEQVPDIGISDER
jgi:DNA-binding IclR family transcriptional regulator